ncbi:TPA: hypothetical protein HA335_00115 [Methanocaldococcus jannaschii]|uniref:Uncharacterized protein MJ1290 n=2 Tax=Methanocaldococcus jannaschii TaxID=2190 RepID=Y1290_METJA|nr:hypothetical protein [Methanocaldococcus jannaschii]Q58686.2 RecName: Full=Uncharacterized protein MJ1290 [Methanocaldococcus jannaschii DSM 2661]AAB99296.1 hypothetical protein MJ_1290 [Methanocaldococcus jannaschii DSM 2661]HII58985.1 hypothetical protein [Methanocaldococcus jannaschii]
MKKAIYLLILCIFGLFSVYFTYAENISDISNTTSKNISSSNISHNNIIYSNINYNEILYIIVKNNTAYVKDVINGTNNPYHIKSAGIILYEKIYGYNYSNLLYRNSSNSLIFYYNFSVDKINYTINITIPQIEDYVGSLGGPIRMRIPPNNVKIIIVAENKLAETNGKYILEYNKTDKKVISLIYLDNVSSICNIYYTKFFNSSEFYGYAVANVTSITENRTSYTIKNPKGTFTFDRKYNVFVSNKTAYLKEPYLYVKLYNSTIDDIIILENNKISENSTKFMSNYLLSFIGIIIGFGIIGLAIYLSKRGRK